MKLNRAELRKIMYDFNSLSNRLMQVDFDDYTDVATKFINFIKRTPVIFDFITDCGICDQDLVKEFSEIGGSYGNEIFSLGDEPEEEIRNVFAILEYIVEKKIEIHYGVAMGYSHSQKYQDMVKGFNDRVVMVLIRHIEAYLTKIGIDMGLDEKIVYQVTVEHGQVNIATDNATINATSNIGIDTERLADLVQAVKTAATNLSEEEQDTLSSNLEVIEEESKSAKPRKGFMKTAIAGLSAIKGTAEFGAAVVALIQFVQTIL